MERSGQLGIPIQSRVNAIFDTLDVDVREREVKDNFLIVSA